MRSAPRPRARPSYRLASSRGRWPCTARAFSVKTLLESLTPREKQILALMAGGADNRTVAERLHISYATVRSHVRSILAKLGARSRLNAVAKATDWGFRG